MVRTRHNEYPYVCANRILQVDSSDEEDDSGSDINTGSRRKRLKIAGGRTCKHPILIVVPTPIVKLTYLASARGNNSSNLQTSAEPESEEDTYGGARGQRFAKKQRQRTQAVASGRDTPSMAEVRFSTRRAGKVANYNENDEDPFSEGDAEDVTPNYWVTAAEDTSPAIDSVLKHRLKEDAGKH